MLVGLLRHGLGRFRSLTPSFMSYGFGLRVRVRRFQLASHYVQPSYSRPPLIFSTAGLTLDAALILSTTRSPP